MTREPRRRGNRAADAPVEEYLDQLRAGLRGRDRELVLAEAEDHLRDSVAAGLAAGLTERGAQEAAISAFGSVPAVVRAHRARDGRVAVLADLVLAAWKLGAAGLIAVGGSGVVAAVMNRVFGRAFIGQGQPGAAYPAARCRYWLSAYPHAHSCAQAALLESSSDAVSLRIVAGVFGLVLLAAYLLVRHYPWLHPSLAGRDLVASRTVVSRDWFPALAATGSGGAAVVMALLLATNTYTGVAAGPGFYWSGIVAALAACAGGTVAARWRRRPDARR